jgi:hypothetical protein
MKQGVQNFGRKAEGEETTLMSLARLEENIKMDPREIVWRMRTEFIWLRIETSGGLL